MYRQLPRRKKQIGATLIADVESRLQFNTFVAIFFGTLLYNFGRLLNAPEADAIKALLHLAGLPIYYVISYGVFEWGRQVIPEWCLKILSYLLLGNVVLLVLPTCITAAPDAHWSLIQVRIGLLAMQCLVYIAVSILVLITGGIAAGLVLRRRAKSAA
jgi:hypothetical protein